MPLIALFIHFVFQETHPSPIRFYAFSAYIAVAGLREGPGGPAPPSPSLFWVKKKERIAERRKAGRASDKKPGPPLARGLDPPLHC